MDQTPGGQHVNMTGTPTEYQKPLGTGEKGQALKLVEQGNLKKIVRGIIEEFVESGDVEEAMTDISKSVQIEGPDLVKEAVIYGMEHNAFERELISQFLAQAYNIFHGHDIQNGFQVLLDRLPDLILDVPSAPELLAKFVARAIFDEILAPAFLKEATIGNKEASRVISLSYENANAPEKKRLDRIWGAGALVSVRRLRKEVHQILDEYLDHQDPPTAASSIKELNVPHFHVEAVKQCLEIALEQKSLPKNSGSPGPASKDKGKLLELLLFMESIALVSKHDIQQAFQLLWDKVGDITLDVPRAKELLTELMASAKDLNLLEKIEK